MFLLASRRHDRNGDLKGKIADFQDLCLVGSHWVEDVSFSNKLVEGPGCLPRDHYIGRAIPRASSIALHNARSADFCQKAC